jgi:hypothetical protein
VGPDERAPATELPPPLPPPPHLPSRAIPIWQWFCELPHVRACCSAEHVPLIEQVVIKVLWQRRAIARLEASDGELTESVTYGEGAGARDEMRAEVNMVLAYGKQITAELARLGLTPTDRSRVASLLSDTRKADPLAEFRVR